MRLLLDLIVGINAVAGIIGFTWRRQRKRRELSHAEYVAELQRQNAELDRERERMSRLT